MKNNNKICVLLIIFIFIFALSSCEADNINEIAENQSEISGDEKSHDNVGVSYDFTAREIADTIIAAFSAETLPQMKKYISGVDENSEFYLEADYAGILMTGRYGAPEEMNYAADFAFYTPIGHNVFEINVVKLDDIKNKDAITDMLQNRLNRKKAGDIILYNPEEMPILNAAIVIDVEDYVMLLCTTDNNKALNIINDLFDGNTVLLKSDEAEENTEESEQPEIEQIILSVDGNTVDVPSNIIFDFALLTPEEKSGLSAEEITPMPTVRVQKHSHNEIILIGGRCAENAMIRITGGLEEILTNSDYGDFLVEVPISKEDVSVLNLSAKLDGREWSDEIKFIVKAKNDVTMFDDGGIYAVIVGDDYQSVFFDCVPDYIGSNLINDAEKTALQTRVEKKYQDFRERGMTTEIIYLLIPNPMNIYAELMPKRYTRFTENSLTKQFTEAVTAGGATVIDLTDTMMAHKHDNFRIFFKTDSHWTEYGAFLGYTELMNHISQKFPDAAPRPINDFRFYNRQVNFGDIYNTLRLEQNALRETGTFVEFLFEPPCGHAYLYNDAQGPSVVFDHNVMSRARTTNTNLSGNFPSAYIFRDSFGGSIHAFLTDRFSEISWQAYWNYKYNINTIAENNPDYIIYLITERNIRNIMYE